MRKILLATTLLSIATSENIMMEKHSRPTVWIHERQFWSKRPKRMSRDDIPSGLKDISSYNDDRQFPRISDGRFVDERAIEQLPPIAVIRRPDLLRFSQVGLLPSDKLKLDNPAVTISIGIQEKNAPGESQDKCSTRKIYRKHGQDWQRQQPFYVEEPQWIEIEPNYTEGSVQHQDDGDPYIMSRGKKFRIKSPDRLKKAIEDYKEFFDYASGSNELPLKSRARRSVDVTDTDFSDDVFGEKRDPEEGTSRYSLLGSLEGSEFPSIRVEGPYEELSKVDGSVGEKTAERMKKNVLVSSVPYKFETNKAESSPEESQGREFAKRSGNPGGNDTSIARFLEEEGRLQRQNVPSYLEGGNEDTHERLSKRSHGYRYYYAVDANKGDERALENGVFVGMHDKRTQYEDNADRKKSIRTRGDGFFLNSLNNFNKSEKFIISRGKKPFNRLADSYSRDTRLNGFPGGWRDSFGVSRYANHRQPKRQAKEINRDNGRPVDSQSISEPDQKSFPGTARLNYREKRNIYETRPEFQEDELLRNIEEIAEAEAYLKPRDKHSNIRDLQEDLKSYFISVKGKKALGGPLGSSMTRQWDNAAIQEMHYSIARDLLKMLLAERSKCNEAYCDDMEAVQSLKSRPVLRNRRESLAKMLDYDPFVIIRGKRMKLGNL